MTYKILIFHTYKRCFVLQIVSNVIIAQKSDVKPCLQSPNLTISVT